MKSAYEEPIIEIRKYPAPPVLTEVSYTENPNPDLEGGDEYPDIFA